MNKIGILTFHDTLNYGATLQCYALQRALKKSGTNVDVIDYKCPRFEREYSPFYIEEPNLKKFLYMIVAFKMNVEKKNNMKRFVNKYITLSKKYAPADIKSANSEYDAFVCGSDQVWNYGLTDFDKTYFLDFVNEDKKKYSYAASFGFSKVPEDKVNEYKKLLSGYDRMSVREETGANILNELIGQPSEVVVDPCVLLGKEEWSKIAVKPDIDNYILLYKLNNTKVKDYAVKLAKETGKKLVWIAAPLKARGDFRKEMTLGPDEFVGWFKYADYVVTDSFHGTIFSTIFERQFYSFISDKIVKGNSRIVDFLTSIQLNNRIMDTDDMTKDINTPIDYVNAKMLLENKAANSKAYLNNLAGDLK